MRTLTATVTAKQKKWGSKGICKTVFTSGATTYGYLTPTLIYCHNIEKPYSQTAQITINNADNVFDNLDLKGYKCVLSWGIDTGVSRSAWVANTAYSVGDVVVPTTANGYQYKCTTAGTSHAATEPTWTTAIGTTISDGTVTWTVDGKAGDEYSECAPMWVEAQQLDDVKQNLACHFSLAGMFNLMAKDEANADYILASSDTQTVKTLITAIANGTIAVYDHCTNWNVQYDSEDSLIDVYIPADGFSISEGTSRLSVLETLLKYTKCVMRAGNDGKLHILNPTVSGTTYDSAYALDTDSHKFFAQTYRKRLVIPNYILVRTRVGDSSAYTGSATDTESNGLMAKNEYVRIKAVSDAQCAAVAAARLQKYQQDAEKGIAIAPMNIGSELWDYVNVVDSKMSNINRVGNLQHVERTLDLREKTPRYPIQFTFGKMGITALGTPLPSMGISTVEAGPDSTLTGRVASLEADMNDVSAIIEVIKKLSGIEIDISKNWNAKKITNLGDPTADQDAVTKIFIKTNEIIYVIDGGGSAITTGVKGFLEIPFACTITQATLVADQSGSIVVDIWKDTYANFPPTDADSITASAPPTISSAQKSQDATLTGWTTAITAGNILGFNVDSCTTITRVAVCLKVTRS